jgi:hypothetical protein
MEDMMKLVAFLIALSGVIALILAFLNLLTHSAIMGVTRTGYIRGASSLFLLTLVVIAIDRSYFQKK